MTGMYFHKIMPSSNSWISLFTNKTICGWNYFTSDRFLVNFEYNSTVKKLSKVNPNNLEEKK